MKERIYGTETEYGVSPAAFLRANDKSFRKILEHFPLGQAMKDLIDVKWAVQSVFLKNEARFYCDTGAHPEYASPETRRLRDCVRWEKAGERILEDAASAINREADAWVWKRLGGVTFIKNNCNPFGNFSWGWHQNFLIEHDCDFIFLAEALTPFLVTSYIWDGSGKAHIAGDGTLKFFLSQRAPVMNSFLGPWTTSQRSMISTRDDPHADGTRWRRLHIIAKDSHMSELIIYLDMALMGLIIEMCEEGFLEKGANLLGVPLTCDIKTRLGRDYFAMMRELNQDLTLKRVFSVDGGRFRALDVQWKYFQAMKRYEKSAGLDRDTKDALDRFEALLVKFEEAAEEDEPEYVLAGECDWAAKRVSLKADAERHGYSLEEPANALIEIASGAKSFKTRVMDRIQMLDINFHDVRRDHGLHYIMEKKGKRARILDEEEIASAKENPPGDTRAAWRGWWRKKIEELGLRVLFWDWTGFNTSIKDCRGSATAEINRKNLNPFQSGIKVGKKTL